MAVEGVGFETLNFWSGMGRAKRVAPKLNVAEILGHRVVRKLHGQFEVHPSDGRVISSEEGLDRLTGLGKEN